VDARYIQHCCPLLMVRSSEDACLYVLSGIWGPQLFCMQAHSFCILLGAFFMAKSQLAVLGGTWFIWPGIIDSSSEWNVLSFTIACGHCFVETAHSIAVSI
jgi:hypothetical protein